MVAQVDTRSDIYRRHADELTRFATNLVGPNHAQDVVSEAVKRAMSLHPRVGVDGYDWLVPDATRVGAAGLVVALWDHVSTDPELERVGTCAGDRASMRSTTPPRATPGSSAR